MVDHGGPAVALAQADHWLLAVGLARGGQDKAGCLQAPCLGLEVGLEVGEVRARVH